MCKNTVYTPYIMYDRSRETSGRSNSWLTTLRKIQHTNFIRSIVDHHMDKVMEIAICV